MSRRTDVTYKRAETAEEFEAIQRLYYRTFVEEIPQFPPNPEGRLVDQFRAGSTYLIAIAGGSLIGMVALRTERPFSLDFKVPALDSHLPSVARWGEVRLLAIEPRWRRTRVFGRLIVELFTESTARALDGAVVSATTRQLPLYENLGFTPFGDLVGTEGAWYQPMYVLAENAARRLARASNSVPRGTVSTPA